jgi:hypothetical protein
VEAEARIQDEGDGGGFVLGLPDEQEEQPFHLELESMTLQFNELSANMTDGGTNMAGNFAKDMLQAGDMGGIDEEDFMAAQQAGNARAIARARLYTHKKTHIHTHPHTSTHIVTTVNIITITITITITIITITTSIITSTVTITITGTPLQWWGR